MPLPPLEHKDLPENITLTATPEIEEEMASDIPWWGRSLIALSCIAVASVFIFKILQFYRSSADVVPQSVNANDALDGS